ncbi:hypothetical protein evm_001740 [Chilo suppressalis]|nr:hypothetical protein evm_001740 [Chilo suppressalis]
MKTIFFLSACLISCHCQNIEHTFKNINEKFVQLNAIAADISWQSSIDPGNPELRERATEYQKTMLLWQQDTCETLATLGNRHLLNAVQRRQTYLLCRGPKYTYKEARAISYLYDELQSTYTHIGVCIPARTNKTKGDRTATEEAAILDYLSNVERFLRVKDGARYAAKLAGNEGIERGDSTLCLRGENDFDRLMRFSKHEQVLKWLWLCWREKTGLMKQPFSELVTVENEGARRNGYSDIGASWRDEIEINNLKQFCRRLYSSIRPFYTLLHGIVRYYLRARYGNIVPEKGPIPAHLLGNLWSQNWEPLIDFITLKSVNLDASVKKLNWTVEHMAKRAEDFYQSMGLPPMTPTFWRESVFENKNGNTRCHGTAADMFENGDYRLLYCSETSMEDFYVLHHEFGHIHYYMAYADQPGLFRQANAAFHESIGDAIMYGVMTPQHLHRLGIVNDSILYSDSPERQQDPKSKDESKINESRLRKSKTIDSQKYELHEALLSNITDYFNNVFKTNDDQSIRATNDSVVLENAIGVRGTETIEYLSEDEVTSELDTDKENGDVNNKEFLDLTTDELLLLKVALNKIPQIPFALAIDEYRWGYFEGGMDINRLNKEFWDLTLELQGIVPPEERTEEYFDVASKFHIPDNTPYIRYFLSSFIQHQVFEALCRAAVFGRRDMNTEIPDTITLNRCDIYGSKAAGKLLRDFMSRGNSQHWREILFSTTGNTDITPLALQRYYRPLYEVLERFAKRKGIPLGW